MKPKKTEKLNKGKRLKERYLAQLKYKYFIISASNVDHVVTMSVKCVALFAMRRQGQHSNKAHIKSVVDDIPSKSVAYEEMKQLKLDITKLPSDKLGTLMNIIHTRENGLRDSVSGEIEVDFETLKISTLRAMQRFVAACLGKVNTNGGSKYSSVLLC